MIIRSMLEALAVILVIVGFLYEDKIARFENAVIKHFIMKWGLKK